MRMTVMRGYPGSGKSTAARDLAGKTSASIVCRDDIRKRLFGRYTNVDEDAVTAVETAEVQALLASGKSVIVDAMHLQSKYVKKWATMASEYGAEFDIYDMLTDVSDCIVNDADIDRAREGKQVGHAVINKLAKRYPQSKWQPIQAPDALVMDLYVPPKGKPHALIVDIDGTAAHHEGNRSPYDYTKVYGDSPDPCIRDIIRRYHDTGIHTLFVSGREDSCREDTERWLMDHGFPVSHLWMRKSKDYRNDTIVKLEIFNEFIRNDYRVLFVMDDRDRVVRMWRGLGLKCLQVEPGNF